MWFLDIFRSHFFWSNPRTLPANTLCSTVNRCQGNIRNDGLYRNDTNSLYTSGRLRNTLSGLMSQYFPFFLFFSNNRSCSAFAWIHSFSFSCSKIWFRFSSSLLFLFAVFLSPYVAAVASDNMGVCLYMRSKKVLDAFKKRSSSSGDMQSKYRSEKGSSTGRILVPVVVL